MSIERGYGCAFSEALRSKPEENSQPSERYLNKPFLKGAGQIRMRIADWRTRRHRAIKFSVC